MITPANAAEPRHVTKGEIDDLVEKYPFMRQTAEKMLELGIWIRWEDLPVWKKLDGGDWDAE